MRESRVSCPQRIAMRLRPLRACIAVLAAGLFGRALAYGFEQPPLAVHDDFGGTEAAVSVATDGVGSAYVAVVGGEGNGKVVKYSGRGSRQWVVEFDPGNLRPDNQYFILESTGLSAVTVDGKGDVYAVGESYNGTDLDCLLAKYDSRGNLVWTSRYSDPIAGVNDYCHDVTIDPSGNIVAAGARNNGTAYRILLLKWASNGSLVGQGPTLPQTGCINAPCMAQALSVAIDGAGNVYTIDRYWINSRHISKYDASLAFVKRTAATYGVGLEFEPMGLAADSAGNVYAGGYQTITEGEVAYQHHKLLRFDANLNKLCEDRQLYDVLSYYHDQYDHIWAVTVAPNGNAIVTGAENGNVMAMEYDALCRPQWKDGAGSPSPLLWNGWGSEWADIGFDVTLDRSGNLIIAGQTYASSLDPVVLKYAPVGR